MSKFTLMIERDYAMDITYIANHVELLDEENIFGDDLVALIDIFTGKLLVLAENGTEWFRENEQVNKDLRNSFFMMEQAADKLEEKLNWFESLPPLPKDEG